jgi:dienelactone hydrolase
MKPLIKKTSPWLNFKKLLSVALLFTAAGSLQTTQAEPSPTTKVKPGKEYVYKKTNGIDQKLEVYFPKDFDPAKEKVPGVLLFHGGGWRGGDLNQLRYACEYLAKRGLVAATANYYMKSEEEAKALPQGISRKRVCVTDAASALHWFKQHASELGVDPNRIVIGGASAGGHIALLSTLQNDLDDPADPKDMDKSVKGYLFFCSAFTTDGKDNDKTVDAFANLKPGIVPSLFLFGEQDPWLPASQELVRSLKKTGANTKLLVADKVGHMYFMKQEWYDATLNECDRFLISLGLLKGDPLSQKKDGFDFDPQKSIQ